MRSKKTPPSAKAAKTSGVSRTAKKTAAKAPARAAGEKRAPAPRAPVKRATPLRILMVASEATPFSKTGGLADVASALARALGELGHEVTLFTPRYGGVAAGERRGAVRAYVAGNWFDADLHDVPLGPGARAMLVDCPPLYARRGLYAENNVDYGDNPVRFAFLAIAALEWAASQPEPPSVMHGHDWQTGLLPVYAQRFGPETVHAGPMLLRDVPSVFTIHNLAYQGVFEKAWVPALGLRWEDFTAVRGFEFWDRVSFLKAGIMFSDALTTVSPTYAEEIQRPEYGYGFEGILRMRRAALTGILNGIDDTVWNPARDEYLPVPFSAENLGGKAQAKRALLAAFGIDPTEEAMQRPVVGIVSRFAEQKGFDLIEAAASRMATFDATFIVVGTGDPRYEYMWRALAQAHPDRVAAFIGFDERRAHLVEGGADIFLMPSRYEPCGLNQMYSMRYGTVPVVRAVGGLVDTVKPYDPRNGQGTGFLFSDYDAAALLATLSRAIDVYREQQRPWRRLQLNGMKKDFSWGRSAAEYLKVYKRVIAARQKT